MADSNGWRIVPETADLDIAKDGDTIAHWAVFRGPAQWEVCDTFPTKEAAETAIAGRDDSNVFHIGALDDEFAAAFDPLKPWVFDSDDGQECFATEDEACARQRAYREGLGFDPMTGEARPHV